MRIKQERYLNSSPSHAQPIKHSGERSIFIKKKLFVFFSLFWFCLWFIDSFSFLSIQTSIITQLFRTSPLSDKSDFADGNRFACALFKIKGKMQDISNSQIKQLKWFKEERRDYETLWKRKQYSEISIQIIQWMNTLVSERESSQLLEGVKSFHANGLCESDTANDDGVHKSKLRSLFGDFSRRTIKTCKERLCVCRRE